MNILDIIQKATIGKNLSFEESQHAMEQIMSGKMLPSQFGSLMTSLTIKGETAEEIAGMASIMRKYSLKIPNNENAIDMCGTGGSGLKWLNISTASSIIVASSGIPVAKHGNRAMTGNSGSADVLEELGVNINLTPDQASKCLEDINLVFIFAQSFHPSMKYAAPLRREIGIRTIFNFLGPLTNPASVTKQIIGTPNKLIAKKIALAAKILKTERIITLSGKSGADEIEIDNDTYIYDSDNNFEEKILQPRIPNKYSSQHLVVGSPKESAKKILECFRLNSVKNINLHLESVLESILINSALAISLYKPNSNIDSCYEIAKENLLSGNAMKKLEELINFSNKI